MSKKEKALARLRQNPRHVRYQDLENILMGLGFVKRQDGTSHATFRYESYIITVPKLKPFVKPVYVRMVLDTLDEIHDFDSTVNED